MVLCKPSGFLSEKEKYHNFRICLHNFSWTLDLKSIITQISLCNWFGILLLSAISAKVVLFGFPIFSKVGYPEGDSFNKWRTQNIFTKKYQYFSIEKSINYKLLKISPIIISTHKDSISIVFVWELENNLRIPKNFQQNTNYLY